MTAAEMIRQLDLAATDTQSNQAAESFWRAARELERASLLDPWPADGASRVAYVTLASLACQASLDADLARWADDGGRVT